MNSTLLPCASHRHRTIQLRNRTTRAWAAGVLLLIGLAAGPVQAQAPLPEEVTHQELRALRTNVVEAITKGDFERTLQFVHTNVVVTWQNAEVCRGHDGLRAFFNRMGKDAFKGYRVPPTPDEPTLLYLGGVGVSFGQAVAHYHVLGKELDFTNRWTATLVRQGDRWQLAAYHVSNNVLDNPLINAAKGALTWAGALAFVAGLVAGLLLGRRGLKASPAR